MTTSSSGNELPHHRTPEILSIQRSSSQDSRVSALSSSTRSPSRGPATAQSRPPTSSPISPDNWSFSTTTQQPRTQLPMIGGPSFYDPDQALAQGQVSADYQHWVENYGGSSQMDYSSGAAAANAAGLSQFRQQRLQQQQGSRIESVPMQNQYQFVSSGQYRPPPVLDTHFIPISGRQVQPLAQASPSSLRPLGSEYSTSIRTHQQQQLSPGSLHGAVEYNPVTQQQTMSNDPYFYSTDLVSGDQSYNYGSSHQQPHYQSPVDQATGFTPNSDLHTLPPNTSVSPPPWTEERLPPGYATGTSAAGPSTAGPSAQRPRLSQPAGKRDRGTAAKKIAGRKRQRKSGGGGGGGGGDSESESDEDASEAVQMSSRGAENLPTRLPGACTHCKKLKMKCDFPKHENTCKRCKAGGHHCIVEGRKPRTAPNKREYLLAQIRQKDAIIESLLKQLHNPYLATPLSIASYRMATSPSDQNNRDIIAWLDKLQASVRSAGLAGGDRAFKLESRTKNAEDSDPESGDGREDDIEIIEPEDALPDPETMQSLPDAAVPLGLIADLSLSNNKAKAGSHNGDVASTGTLDDDNVGVANETYFMPGPATDLGIRAMLIEQHSPPEILVHGLVAPEDVEKLFDIFYQRINAFISLLDPVLHTPASTFARCPFLFTVICAVSSRYYSEKSEIYPIAMHFAKHSAANALIDGWKSVELCQAYILMSIYAVPARRWEEDRSWLYTGLAIRIATDLNLHQVSTTKPQTERQEREILNRTRVWMICCNLDRSTATQFGKPSTIKEDYVMRNSADWYKKSQFNHKYDVHLCAYSAMLRIVAAFHDDIFSDPDSPSGLNKNIDFLSVTLTHDENLTRYHEEWAKRFNDDSDPNDRGSAFRCTLLPFLTNYSRLVMFSFGFQQAFQRGFEQRDEIFFTKCFEAAKLVIKNFIDYLAPSGYMRYSADGHFVFSSFASAFLLKLLRPELSHLMTHELEAEIFDLIGRLIQKLSSPDIAIDDRHTPKLYARFLASLLARNRKDGTTSTRSHHQPPPQSEIAHAASGGYTSNIPTTSNASFSVTSPEGENQGGHDGGFPHSTFNTTVENTDPPVYPEPNYTLTSDPAEFGGSGNIGLDSSTNVFRDEEMLAPMQALRNPQWWTTMMMPGFSWPDTPMMNGIQGASLDSLYSQNVPGLHQGFGYQGLGSFHPTEVPLN